MGGQVEDMVGVKENTVGPRRLLNRLLRGMMIARYMPYWKEGEGQYCMQRGHRMGLPHHKRLHRVAY